jgi:hypothetical protein
MNELDRETGAGVVVDRVSARDTPRIAVIAVAIVAVFLGASWLLAPREVPLPEGATPLTLRTQPAPLIPISLGCPLALLAPVTVSHDAGTMTFLSELTNEPIDIAWPNGWSARLLNGRAELVRPDSRVLARDGELIRDRVIGGINDDGTFLVCSTDSMPTNPEIPSEKPPDPL